MRPTAVAPQKKLPTRQQPDDLLDSEDQIIGVGLVDPLAALALDLVEESFELIGITLLLAAVSNHLSRIRDAGRTAEA